MFGVGDVQRRLILGVRGGKAGSSEDPAVDVSGLIRCVTSAASYRTSSRH